MKAMKEMENPGSTHYSRYGGMCDCLEFELGNAEEDI
jgi:hypothetical protein